MKIQRFNNSKLYYQKVKAYLLQEEAVHCMILGISNTLNNSPNHYSREPYLVTVEENNQVLATAIRTPPYKLLLSRSLQSETVVAIARDLAGDPESLAGVIAPEPEATTFAQTWHDLTGKTYRQALALRVNQLEVVSLSKQVSGDLRQVTANDRNFIIDWIEDFYREALGDNEPRPNSDRWFNLHLQQGRLYIWQDKIAVSMVAYSDPTPNGIRINAVYTPPEYRKNGYATSCVATLSRKLLAQGYKYCFLYTDLNNSTFNNIYQKIGYQPVCEIINYSFE